MKTVGAIVLGLVATLALVWVLAGNNLAMAGFFSPRYEQVRRNTFEQSKAYNQGMIQELQNMQFEYEQADAAHQDALRAIILHRAADYDENRLPADLRSFIDGLKGEK